MVAAMRIRGDGRFGKSLQFSGVASQSGSMPPASLRLVPFKEIRHDQPDDCLHYESVSVRGEELDWIIPAHRHAGLYQFQFLREGSVHGSIDGRDFAAEGPVLLLLAPGSVHGFTYSRNAVGHQVTVPAATLHELLGDAQFVSSHLGTSFILPQLGDGQIEECQQLFSRIARDFQQMHVGRVPALLASATLLAVLFIRGHGDAFDRLRPQGVRDTLVQRYLALVEERYRSHEALGGYAQTLGVTVDHLSRTCRAVLQQSALGLLNERRMLEARRLLAYTPMSVAQVAQEIGYEDPAYFSRIFQRHTGQAPSAYRALVMQGVRYR